MNTNFSCSTLDMLLLLPYLSMLLSHYFLEMQCQQRVCETFVYDFFFPVLFSTCYFYHLSCLSMLQSNGCLAILSLESCKILFLHPLFSALNEPALSAHWSTCQLYLVHYHLFNKKRKTEAVRHLFLIIATSSAHNIFIKQE